MIRLLVTLSVMLVVVLVVYILTVNSTVNTLMRGTLNSHAQSLGQGTMQLLNEAVAGLGDAERAQKVTELQQQFAYPLNLRPLTELKVVLAPHQFVRLEQGLIARHEIDNADYLYGLLPSTDQAWEVALDQTQTADEINTSKGTAYLLQQEFAGYPQSEWADVLAKRQAQFGFPLELHRLRDVSLSEAQKQQLLHNEVVVIFHNEDEETHYQRLYNSDYVLQLGVFSPPWIGRHVNKLVLATLALLLVISSYLWLWPLWRNLMQIKTAAEAFGNGDYDTRVPYHKRSRLAVVTKAFNAMAERTQHSIRSQKELTSAVSHELRTPVARMRFSLDMLAETDSDEDRQRYMTNMNLDIEELNTLLEELLTYSRLDQFADTVQVSRVPLMSWFASTMDGMLPLAGEKTLAWDTGGISEHDIALMSPVMMRRVVNNLVQNALHYADSRVEICLSQSDNEYVLQVNDDGPGVPESDRERLFKAFTMLDESRSKETGGFGLGLAIVKRIVEGHGGQVSIDDSPLGGAQFMVCWEVSDTQHHIQLEEQV